MIKDSQPIVKLFLEGIGLPSPELGEALDYSKADDQIVGCLHRFRQENPEVDARLLTGDRGPMMAARSLGLPYLPIREGWLLPPENNETERENARLKDQIARLEKAEPQFKIELVDENGKTVEQLNVEYLIYEPLSESDIETLMDSLTNRFPMRKRHNSRRMARQKIRIRPPKG